MSTADAPGRPAFAEEISRRYRGGTVCEFFLHGNIHDLVGYTAGDEARFTTLKRYLGEVLFAGWDTVIYYDQATGIHFPARQDLQDFHKVVDAVNLASGTDYSGRTLPKDPLRALFVIERYLRRAAARGAGKRRVALLIDYADLVADAGSTGGMREAEKATLVTLMKWAGDPDFLAADIAICLLAESLSAVNPQLVRHPRTAAIEVPLPDRDERLAFLRHHTRHRPEAPTGEGGLGIDTLAKLTGGLNRVNLTHLVDQAVKNDEAVTLDYVQAVKKDLIEKACHGMLEFLEPRWTLDQVAGHEAAKSWLQNDASLLAKGALDVMPMGYLVCGPVGTGKTFLVRCFTGSIGIPCAIVKNLRSQWQGVTESNWERVLAVLKATGPVGVVIDEADATLGDRNQSGDSGTSGRIFSMIAQQMGDTRYRGFILWFLITCRPDLLPIDLKRQGRAEVHIPLFYPQTRDEREDLFAIMAKKVGANLEEGARVPEAALEDAEGDEGMLRLPRMSGADMEGVLVRARRISTLRDSPTVSARDVEMAFQNFVPTAHGQEIELQTVAAVIECTDKEFLPEAVRDLDRAELGRRLRSLKAIVD